MSESYHEGYAAPAEGAGVEALRLKCLPVLANAQQLLGNIDQLLVNGPTIREKLEQNPQFLDDLEGLRACLNSANTELGSLNKVRMEQWVEDYNFYAGCLNEAIQQYETKEGQVRARALETGTNPAEYADYEASLTPEEKAEIRAFVSAAWKDMFPPTYVDQIALWTSATVHGMDPQRAQLSEAQRLALAPANGVESAVVGVAALLHPQTYVELWHSIETLYGMSPQEWAQTVTFLKFMSEDLSTTDVVAPAISALVGMIFIAGGLDRFKKAVKTMEMPEKLREILTLGNVVRALRVAEISNAAISSTQALPLGILAGNSFKAIPL